MRDMGRWAALAAAGAMLAGCSVWAVNQDPDGIAFRQDANHLIWALQDYRKAKGNFPARLNALAPGYIAALPEVPGLRYDPRVGGLSYRYIPTWPQLRWTLCQSVGNTTEWRCEEHTGFLNAS